MSESVCLGMADGVQKELEPVTMPLHMVLLLLMLCVDKPPLEYAAELEQWAAHMRQLMEERAREEAAHA